MKEEIVWVPCTERQGFDARFAGIDFWWPGPQSRSGFRYRMVAINEDGPVHMKEQCETMEEARLAAYEYASRYIRLKPQLAADARQILHLCKE